MGPVRFGASVRFHGDLKLPRAGALRPVKEYLFDFLSCQGSRFHNGLELCHLGLSNRDVAWGTGLED